MLAFAFHLLSQLAKPRNTETTSAEHNEHQGVEQLRAEVAALGTAAAGGICTTQSANDYIGVYPQQQTKRWMGDSNLTELRILT